MRPGRCRCAARCSSFAPLLCRAKTTAFKGRRLFLSDWDQVALRRAPISRVRAATVERFKSAGHEAQVQWRDAHRYCRGWPRVRPPPGETILRIISRASRRPSGTRQIEPMIKLINLNDVDESGGSCLAIEAERRFARLGYSVSRLCGF